MTGKIEVYLRSIERFGAAGALLTSGQPVTLRFPTGDRHATQVTPHDQLVALVREVAPPAALDQIDRNRPARFDFDTGNTRYQISVQPRPNAWQVLIEPASAAASSAPKPPPPAGSAPKSAPFAAQQQAAREQRPSQSQPAVNTDEAEMYIERGQYEAPTGEPRSSGSALLDLLTGQARAANASDLILTAGSPAFMRVAGALTSTSSRSAIDADLLARELGVVAPPEARQAWMERGQAMFTYGDGLGRVRVTLTRDHRGPGASLRLLVGEAPSLEQLGLAEADNWLEERGLILISGPSGAGKTTTLAAMVRGLAERRRRVVAIEDPIEIVHVSPWISQRAVGEHVPNIREGTDAAMLEGVDAIVIGSAQTPESAQAVIEAAIGGHLVVTTVVAPIAQVAADRLIDRLPADQRAAASHVLADMLLGTIAPIVGLEGERTFEVFLGRPNRR